ncbi:hypothetical protein, partial [Pseudomonas sp. HMSC75E02]|uniref:hypothetical protein n=1 Tax=Pseudomonas sp. HMSC75E02 TaxID=1608908 RepID=UPI001C458537
MQDRSRVPANALRLSFSRKIKYRLTLPLQFGVIASALRSKKKRPCFLSTPYSWRFLQISLYKKINNGNEFKDLMLIGGQLTHTK